MRGFDVQGADGTLVSRRVSKPQTFQHRCLVCTLALACLLIVRLIGLSVPSGLPKTQNCNVLTNQIAYYSIEIGVGTPPQFFSVVIDTGSGQVMIPSCSCVAAGKCLAERCFSEEKSETYSPFSLNGLPLALDITYGMGKVKAEAITDVVHMQNLHAHMHGGVLIMQDVRELGIWIAFEGVLGLGLPDFRGRNGFGKGRQHWWQPLFFDQVGVGRFSICLRQNGPGALRFEIPPLVDPLTIVGDSEWKLGFDGISVGDDAAGCSFCAGSTLAFEAVTDTGTTLILGPLAEVTELFINLCKRWQRCVHIAEIFQNNMTLDVAFWLLLKNCESWLAAPLSDFHELPSIFLHFAAGQGQRSVPLELRPSSFIYQAEIEGGKKVCLPLIDSIDVVSGTEKPSWILGLPLFQEYVVSFDSHSQPPTISFGKEACIECGGDDVDVAAQPLWGRTGGTDGSKPWQVPGPILSPLGTRQGKWGDSQPSIWMRLFYT